MKLDKRQKKIVIEWIAEGLETGEINKRASKFKPPFKVTRQQVDFYRKTRDVKIKEITQTEELSALTSGLALREKRVELLQRLADQMSNDLLTGNLLWTDMEKSLGTAGTFSYKEFNAAEVAQLRGVLDDIAAEVNERVKRQEVTGKNGAPLIPEPTKEDNVRFDRAITTLADAVRESLSSKV